MSWIDEPTVRLPTAEEISLLQIEQGKQLLREAARFAEQSAALRKAAIERAFDVKIDMEQGTINDAGNQPIETAVAAAGGD